MQNLFSSRDPKAWTKFNVQKYPQHKNPFTNNRSLINDNDNIISNTVDSR